MVVVGVLVLAGGVGFFGPKIRANSPGFLGGSWDGSGMVGVPAEVFVLLELVDELLFWELSGVEFGGRSGSFCRGLTLG